jgi:hypothetical protein|tara:strand:+ start:816 stop:1076 length:261 start_codon:yes stop_codon:yes gene_type:complete
MLIGGCGFYHLGADVFYLGTPIFDGSLNIRFRAKTIHSDPIYNYGFLADEVRSDLANEAKKVVHKYAPEIIMKEWEGLMNISSSKM